MSDLAEITAEQAEFQAFAIRRMKFVDDLPEELRECVHEYGLEIVRAFLDHGVKRPKSIRHLIHMVVSQTTGVEPANFANKAMMDRRAAIWLAGGGYLVVPKMPTPEMVEASVNALENAGIAHTGVEKRRKHAVRLIHANVVGHAGVAGKVS